MNWDVVLVSIHLVQKKDIKKKKPKQIKWHADKSKMTDINPRVAILTPNVNKLKIQSKDIY